MADMHRFASTMVTEPIPPPRMNPPSRRHQPDWNNVKELNDKLGFHDPTASSVCCGGLSITLLVVQAVMFLVITSASVWSKLEFLTLISYINPKDNDDERQRPVAFSAVALAIFCPYAWGLLWKLWRTPLRTHPEHVWPDGSGLMFILIIALCESAGITIFCLVVCPKIPSLLALGMMCLVFVMPRVHVINFLFGRSSSKSRTGSRKTSAGRGAGYMLVDNADLEDAFHSSINGTQRQTPPNLFIASPQSNTSKAVSFLGSLIQLVCIGAIPVYTILTKDASINDEDHLVSIFAPVSIVLLGIAWWPTLHDRLGIPQPKAQTTPTASTSQGGNNEPALGPMQRFKPTSTMRSSLISFLFRCIFSGAAIYIISVNFSQECDHNSKSCEFWKYFGQLGLEDFKDILISLLSILLCSLVAYHCARYSMMMGLQRAGFGIPFSLTPIITALVVIGVTISDMRPVHFRFDMDKRDWWPHSIFVVLAAMSALMSSAGYTFRKRIPRLAMDETLFYQNAYSAVFVDQFALISRRSAKGLADEELRREDGANYVLSTEEELARSTIFVCTTMYNEDEHEMEQLLSSVISSGLTLGTSCTFQSHIFMDGGMQGDNEPGFKALQLIRVLNRTAKAIIKERKKAGDLPAAPGQEQGQRANVTPDQPDESEDETLEDPDEEVDDEKEIKRTGYNTPYGVRLEFTIAGRLTINIHLKDPSKVRKKKRWSQVMYMYYLIRYQVDTLQMSSSDNAYILATDADIQFSARDVTALLMMIARDRSVGAVCGRTYPLGTGPLVWYQHFDYAVGHWFQKAAEHVLGTVLCCPGCFSLFRVDALREAVLEYKSPVNRAFEFLTKDMGEDRWLCTLLVVRGWRLEYCAAAKDKTYCPDSIEVFFNQRRRWIVSTMANMWEILRLSGDAVKRNASVSYAYIVYTALMLVSTVVSPATVLLVMIGGFNYVLGWDIVVVEAVLFSVTILYLIICLFASQQTQFLFAKILTAIFAIIMALVFVGLVAQVADDFTSAVHPKTQGSTTTAPVTTTTHRTLPPLGANDTLYASTSGNNPSSHTHHRITGVGSGEGDLSMSTVYLLTMIAMFLLAGFLHLGEFTDLIHGVWYLLCLPAGYLFLLIYACCNLNDRSWGTRTAATEGVLADGTVIRGPTSWWRLLLFGCGLRQKESLTHFFGRLLCCRRYEEVQDVDVEEERAVLEAPKRTHKPLTWQLVPETGTSRVTEYRVDCQPVSVAIKLLRQQEKKRDELVAAFKQAVLACPMLVDWGRHRSPRWLPSWNPELMCLDSGFVKALTEDTALAEATAQDFELTMEQMTQAFRRMQHEDLKRSIHRHQATLSDADDLEAWITNALDRSDKKRRPDQGRNRQFSAPDPDSPRGLLISALVDRLRENGYNRRLVVSCLREQEMRIMGIDQLPGGEIAMKRIMDAVKEERVSLGSAPKPKSLEKWLDSIGMSQYVPHFAFFDFQPEDITDYTIMSSLNEKRLREMGVVTLAHLRCISDALTTVQKRLKNEKDYKEAVTQREQNVARWEWKKFKRGPLPEEETMFWDGVVRHVLGANLSNGMQEDNLKEDLDSLRNRSVLAFVIINTMWLLFMLVLNGTVADHLRLFGTNPLGVMFIITYGFLFALQFLTMLFHRWDTFVQYVATISVESFIKDRRAQPVELQEFSRS
eukprot:m.119170 g.119170  ORF g.119170 m.119170 type:complete len:1665 (-) comp15462_c2_seq1:532-5526(-)